MLFIRKSSEYLRLSEIKLQISIDTNCRNIICIHLATNYYGLNFDLETALKLSGLKKMRYTLLKRTFEQFLNINNYKLSITEICIKLNLKNIEKIAIDTLEQFSEIVQNKNLNYDLTHPQYAAMAIYQQIRNEKNIKKIKLKLLTFCELTQSQWIQLEEIWNKLLPNPKLFANNKIDNKNDDNSSSVIGKMFLKVINL